MENSFINIVLFPEIALSIATVILLLIGLFQTKNSFNNICNLSILTLIFIFFLVFLNIDFTLANYNDFFINSAFIQFFKGLIIMGSLATIIITKNYFIELKLSLFEIPILILFSILGMMVLISSNDLIAMYLGIELQSLSLYVAADIKRDSIQSSE